MRRNFLTNKLAKSRSCACFAFGKLVKFQKNNKKRKFRQFFNQTLVREKKKRGSIN